MNVKLIGINGRYSHSSLPLFYVRNQLISHCSTLDEIEILQFTINDSYYETLIRVNSHAPQGLFFSAYVWNSDRICQLIRDIKRVHPKCCVVVGGPQAGVVGQNLGEGECTVVIGEIERVSPEFYHDLAGKRLKPLYDTYAPLKRGHFPFPYRTSDFKKHLANRNIYYESSRGCPFSCTYCLSSVDKTLYRKDVEEVRGELTRILQHRPRVIRFVDRTFNDRPERALAIWKFLASREGETTYHFEISPRGFSEEMYQFLGTVPTGLFQFEIGVQSTSQKTLEAIQRPVSSEKACEVISRLADLSTIHLHVDLILGLPYDSPKSFLESFTNVFNTGAHYIQMGLLKILPDTPLHRSCSQYEYQYCGSPPYEIVSTRWMDHQQLQQMYWFGECVEKFINNRYFPSFWLYLRKIEEDISLFFNDLVAICHARSFFQLAPTHELMSEILLHVIQKRSDQFLMKELIRYDWLRCGHRFLPECLLLPGEAKELLIDLRKKLFKHLPEQKEGIYNQINRSHFIKKSIFVTFSGDALEVLGYRDDKQPAILCFLPDRGMDLYRLNRVVMLQAT